MIHSYRIKAASRMVRIGVVAVEGIEPSTCFSVPPGFRGMAGHWTPEHFFVTREAGLQVRRRALPQASGAETPTP
jgi:hypothetical protein